MKQIGFYAILKTELSILNNAQNVNVLWHANEIITINIVTSLLLL